MKPEFYKAPTNNQRYMNILTTCLNSIINTQEIPEECTKMIPGNLTYEPKDLCLIALTNFFYKILMGIQR